MTSRIIAINLSVTGHKDPENKEWSDRWFYTIEHELQEVNIISDAMDEKEAFEKIIKIIEKRISQINNLRLRRKLQKCI